MSRAGRALEIACRACGQHALARAEPVYDGFRKTGELFVCTACGHRYDSREATPFLEVGQRPSLFTAADREAAPRVFKESERRRCCAYCSHRVVNPFGQRCGLSNREVEATDLCARFEPIPGEPPPDGTETDGTGTAKPPPGPDPLARIFGN